MKSTCVHAAVSEENSMAFIIFSRLFHIRYQEKRWEVHGLVGG